MKRSAVPLVATMACLLTACSNPSSPSDANFKKAIETRLNEPGAAQNCAMVFLDERSAASYKEDTFLQALVKNGYITATPIPRTLQTGFYYSKTPGYQFSLTAKGNQTFSNEQFCYGKIAVTNITNYSLGKMPQTGQTFATVTYDYKVVDKPEWLSDDLVTCTGMACAKLNLKTDSTNNQMDLMQGEKGWEPVSLF